MVHLSGNVPVSMFGVIGTFQMKINLVRGEAHSICNSVFSSRNPFLCIYCDQNWQWSRKCFTEFAISPKNSGAHVFEKKKKKPALGAPWIHWQSIKKIVFIGKWQKCIFIKNVFCVRSIREGFLMTKQQKLWYGCLFKVSFEVNSKVEIHSFVIGGIVVGSGVGMDGARQACWSL